jgi:murein L,D-transpeptidase YafK
METTAKIEETTVKPETVQSLGEINKPRIIVRKGDRVLELWDDQVLCASFPVGLGFEPIDHKQVEGDGRTPEGEYYVCTRNPNSRFYKALGVSYPNREDADAGLLSGTIDEQTADLIRQAIERQACPPWNTPLGGEIMIHGHGSLSDWTAGCVAVDNEVMDILWQHSPLGTPITILP